MTDKFEPEYPSEITAEYQYRENQRISQTLNQLVDGHYNQTYTAVDKPRDGDIRYFSSDVLARTDFDKMN